MLKLEKVNTNLLLLLNRKKLQEALNNDHTVKMSLVWSANESWNTAIRSSLSLKLEKSCLLRFIFYFGLKNVHCEVKTQIYTEWLKTVWVREIKSWVRVICNVLSLPFTPPWFSSLYNTLNKSPSLCSVSVTS